MKTTLPTNSKPFEDQINQVTEAILDAAKDKIAFVILFGSFARGDWVEDRYYEDSAVYEYFSDYDFLIITKTGKQAGSTPGFDLLRSIKKEFKKNNLIKKYQAHNPHCIVESIVHVNAELEKGRYFFSDIKKEGILLFDSKEFELSEAKDLTKEEKIKMAKEDYEYWFSKARNFLEMFKFLFEKAQYVDSSFQLHQATEHLYNCALLVLTNYKPKLHDLEGLNRLCASRSNEFLSIFPCANKEQEEAFELLQKAYVDARYNKNYTITKEQLEYLFSRVEALKELVERKCGEVFK